jgi:hypothetical protein
MGPRWLAKPGFVVGGMLFLGLALRSYHYLRNPVVWHDEAALLVNALPLSFAELLGPLRHAEAAPPLFLWLERATSLVLGDGTMAMRLPPYFASVVALLLLAWTAWREVGPAASVWAVLLFASSDRLLWHACEAKPYAFDVLAAVGLLALYSATRQRSITRRVWLFVPLMPVVVWLSYPGCFLCGGVLLGFAWDAWGDRRPKSATPYLALAIAVVGSFAALYFGPARAQRCSAMESCWTGQFPDWHRPWMVPFWSIASTFDAARYCFMPWGYPIALFAIAGGWRLWKLGQRQFVTLAAAPLLLNLLAAMLQGYPFGGARVVVHAAPALAILSAAAIAPCLEWCWQSRRVLTIPVIALLVTPLGLSAYRVTVPWFRPDCAAATEYALRHRTSNEWVYGNHWQFEYYCRALGERFAYLREGQPPNAPSAWVLLTAYDDLERAETVHRLAQTCRIIDHREFVGATAVRVRPIDSTASLKLPARNEWQPGER